MSEPVSILHPVLPEAAGDRRIWRGLHGSALALSLARSLEQAPGPLLVVTADPLAASRLREAVAFFAGREAPLREFPAWETLPWDHFSPYQDIISERLSVMASLPGWRRGALFVPVTTLLQRLAPPEYVQRHSLQLATGQRLEREAFRARLEQAGYQCVPKVQEHGEFAVRGSLLDLFPMGAKAPLRLDLFDEEIESIRLFDPETQRSQAPVEAVDLLPAREFPLDQAGIERFRRSWRERFEGRPTDSPIYQDVSQGLAPGGIEYYLPLFFERTATLFDYLPPETTVVIDRGTVAAAHHFWEELKERYEELAHDRERPLLPPQELWLRTEEAEQLLGQRPRVQVADLDTGGRGGEVVYATAAPPALPVEARAEDPLRLLRQFIGQRTADDGRVLLVAESGGRRETLLELFRRHGLTPRTFEDWAAFLASGHPLGLTVGELDQGLVLERPMLAVISESQLFGERARQQRRRRRARRDAEAVVRDLSELAVGAPVVHEDHGVGRFRGLVTLEAGGLSNEYLQLEYADGDLLYVPVSSLHLVSRYTGPDPEHAPLHKLGSGAWEKAKRRAAKRVRDVAAELLEIHARRAARQGHPFPLDEDAYTAFVQAFPFEETADQAAAIEAVLQDMRSPRPMDRLVCGDVGFGKTEVAMRAAFVAVQGGRQVAVLVPTTLLAQQHYQNFRDRFADWPVRVESFSRFRSRREQEAVLEGLADGSVDIVIGTHKLLGEQVKFRRLGLLVIDEEHRFGVRQKERIKQLRSEVDILTLTATPIPRTLNMALSGIRELSIIATPPARRVAIQTFVREWNDALLRETLMRELARGGQVYFVHNDVETIEKVERQVAALVPEARVRHAHGQMRERELERVMLDFYHQRFNILVCTTIIETGIDVPSANTIIINRADRFGLAQLYQLRGRVGRSHHRAYAYLVVPSRKALKEDARRRLEAIEALGDLGVGFTLATHDLEIRGAGEILGEEQSGQIQEIGYSLYSDMLERAVRSLKAGREPELERPLEQGAEIDLHLPALLPADYLPDVHLRLLMYKRIATTADGRELEELREEMIDRFGPLPEPARNLLRLTALRQRATQLGVRKIDLGAGGGRIVFTREPAIDPAAVIRLIQEQPERYRLDGSEKLRIVMELPEPEQRFGLLEELLEELEGGPQRQAVAGL